MVVSSLTFIFPILKKEDWVKSQIPLRILCPIFISKRKVVYSDKRTFVDNNELLYI